VIRLLCTLTCVKIKGENLDDDDECILVGFLISRHAGDFFYLVRDQSGLVRYYRTRTAGLRF
jgi:hypothetical protein